MSAELETFDAPVSESVTTLTTDELTAICPFHYGSGRDFYALTVAYDPAEKCLETKSFRDYIREFDNDEITAEALANQIYQDIERVVSPGRLYVRVVQNIRGGIQHTEEVGDRSLNQADH